MGIFEKVGSGVYYMFLSVVYPQGLVYEQNYAFFQSPMFQNVANWFGQSVPEGSLGADIYDAGSNTGNVINCALILIGILAITNLLMPFFLSGKKLFGKK